MKEEVWDYDRDLAILYTEDLNMDKMEIEDDDEYQLVVGYAGRM